MLCTLVGDIHGKVNLIKWDSQSPIIQIGDFGFKDTYQLIKDVPPTDLLILGGNHDEYPVLQTLPNYLGNYGIIPGTEKTFFCRGAWSIDRAWRTEGVSWWPEEELTYAEGSKMLDLYEQIKPEVMITHDCPNYLKQCMFQANAYQNRTGIFLNQCLDIHIPKRWYFGHWHVDKHFRWGDICDFICLDEGTHLEVDLP